MSGDPDAADGLKRAAAAAAARLVEDGMLVGLGTGSTAAHVVALLGERHRRGLRLTGVPTSVATARLAREQGIPLLDAPDGARIDLTIDGADEIGETDLSLIKGMGGALLREKIVACASDRLAIIADGSKLAPRLSGRVAIPVEIVAFGWKATRAHLEALGCVPELRREASGEPYRTDNGHWIMDCRFADLSDPMETERALSMVTGVVETGLFIGLATTALVASAAGVRRIDRAHP